MHYFILDFFSPRGIPTQLPDSVITRHLDIAAWRMDKILTTNPYLNLNSYFPFNLTGTLLLGQKSHTISQGNGVACSPYVLSEKSYVYYMTHTSCSLCCFL